ncbi:MAG: transglutaminase domain-containing protein [Brevefilum sp.]
MHTDTLTPQSFYAQQGQISHPRQHAHRLDGLPRDVSGLIQTVQGVMLHLHWAKRYGISLDRTREAEANLRTVKDRLAKIIQLQDAPLTEPRPLAKKTVGTCRDFSLLMATFLRHQGVPARARAGFGTYFTPHRYEDHWVCEYWHAEAQRWVMVDAQLDALQCDALGIDFDPLDMPEGKFMSGGQAWQLCHTHAADPQHFGIFDMHGLGFIKGNVIRDFLALNKIELLPWDVFKLIDVSLHHMNPAQKALIDRLATISSGEDRDFVLLRAAFLSQKTHLLPDYFFIAD